jgi:RNA polymerase sigma-70 factor (ECF subfamily)
MSPEDFERLWEEHSQPLFGFVAYRTGDRGMAEEIVSETFARALAARSRFDRRKAREKTWLYTIALNLVRDNARRAGSRDRALERVAAGAGRGEGEGTRQLDAAEQRMTLAAALETLAEVEREALALRYGADLSAPEIARTLGEPLTTVEGRIYRALRKLRDEMGEEGG